MKRVRETKIYKQGVKDDKSREKQVEKELRGSKEGSEEQAMQEE